MIIYHSLSYNLFLIFIINQDYLFAQSLKKFNDFIYLIDHFYLYIIIENYSNFNYFFFNICIFKQFQFIFIINYFLLVAHYLYI
jgi:hypothetical protein